MAKNDGATDRPVDRAAICLAEWIERGRGYHTPTWDQWTKDTQEDLDWHKERMQLAIGLVQVAKARLLDHNLAAVRDRLDRLEALLK